MIAALPDIREETRKPFLNAKTLIGAIKCSVKPGTTGAMLVEEGCYYAEQKYHWTGVAALGAIVGEGLWTWQEKERREREQGRGR